MLVRNSRGFYNFALDDINGVYQDSNVFLNAPDDTSTVYVRDKNNCEPSISTKVSLIGFPKYFTPNGDGFNDTWQILGISSSVQADSKIYIYTSSLP